MSAETKTKALAKWNAFLPNIGYPDTWRDWSGLDIVPGRITAPAGGCQVQLPL